MSRRGSSNESMGGKIAVEIMFTVCYNVSLKGNFEMEDYRITISRKIHEDRFNHSIYEEWVVKSLEDVMAVLKEIFEIPSYNGVDEEDKAVLTDDDLDKYSDMLQHNGLDEEYAKTECGRIRKDYETFVCAYQNIKCSINDIRSGNGTGCFDTTEYKTASDADITICVRRLF